HTHAGVIRGTSDKVQAENTARPLHQKTKTATHRETPGSARMTGQEALISLSKSFGEKIQNKIEFRGETTFTITADDLREIARFCRDELSFDYLIDITSIDNFGKEPRFEIVYELYSMPGAAHLRLKLKVSEDVGMIDTVCDIWPTANWHEREIYDMMGIQFNGHPDLRRILMWDGHPSFPLRKH